MGFYVSDIGEIQLKVLDLFSGIGGFSLGLERAGMETVAFCEIDPKARKVLAKHWPHVPVFEDVKTLNKGLLDEKNISVDLICGGFPCQDISFAGKGAGIEGERSGLWTEYARIIGELRPQYAIVENVSALLGRGLDRVLGDLAQIGYDAEWHCIPASAVGHPQRRDRIWIVAYSSSRRMEGNISTSLHRLYEIPWSENERRATEWRKRSDLPTPYLCRSSDGVPDRMDRLKQLGNAVVPQIPELIGKAIMEIKNPCRRSGESDRGQSQGGNTLS